MRSPKGLLCVAIVALFFTIDVRGACPDGPDCLWIDAAACGQCADDGRNCGSNNDCDVGPCGGTVEDPGTCSVGGDDCLSDADCTTPGALCVGLCADGATGCFGDGGCKRCNNANSGSGTQASPYCMVDDAFQVASSGDTLYVKPGTYEQCVDVSPLGILSGPEDRPITLIAQAFVESGENPDTIDDTTFDGTDLCTIDPLITIEGSASRLSGFTVTGGELSGVFISGGSVTVSHNKINGNRSVEGGGIAVRTEACNFGGTAEVIISDNEITNNAAEAEPDGTSGEALGHGGGIHVFAFEEFSEGCNSAVTVRIEDNVITGNTVENTNTDSTGRRYVAKGGGLWLSTAMEPGGSALINVRGNEIDNNGPALPTPASAGGGIFATTREDGFGVETIVIEDNAITNNTAHEGGGIVAWAISAPTANHHIGILKNEISSNMGISSSLEGAGGGASLRLEALDMRPGDSISMEFSQNQVDNNEADSSDGGGLRASFLSERSVDESLGANTTPADKMEMIIRDNNIHDNRSAVGGAGALLLTLADSDPVFAETGVCGSAQLPASATIQFLRNLVVNNHGANVAGFTEIGSGILTIPTTYGVADSEIVVQDSTIAGNTIGEDFGGAGGLDTLTYAGRDCNNLIDAGVSVAIDRSIVEGNHGYALGATLLAASASEPDPPADSLVTPATNNYVYDNLSGALRSPYPLPPGNVFAADNFQTDPQLTGAYEPAACSSVFDVRRCDGTTTPCQDNLDCPAGPPQVQCVTGVGFHGNPDIAPDFIIDGLDILDLAVSFNATDTPDPRYSEAADLDHNGIIDGSDLSYMGSQFGQVCNP